MPMPEGRTRVRRAAELQRLERSALDDILDEGRVAHVAIVEDGQPLALPMAYVRAEDDLLLHGSTASRLMRSLAAGTPTCATVTIFDGLVLARSAFESSMHYRSAMVFSRCSVAPDPLDALQRFTEALLPGRWDEVRPTTRKELAKTLVLRLPLEEWSVKVSGSDPEDPDTDRALDIWAGSIPAAISYGKPRPAADLRSDIPLPASVRRLATCTE